MKLTIIGGGPGGYTAAFAAARAGVEVTLVERAHLGGTCLHTGCIPTKTLRSSADALDTVARLREFGIAGDCAATPDMSAIVARKRKVTAILQTGLEKTAAQLKVRVVRGDAEFVGAGLVRVASVDGSLEIAGDRVILATGSSPLELPSLPVDHRLVLSSDDALELQTVPEHLVVVGGGVIGCELAFIYRAFGAKVTVIEGQGRLLPLPSVDGEISRLLLREMKKKGIAVELSHTVSRVTPCDGGAAVEIAPFPTGAGDSRVLNASAVCVTVGRVPNTAGLAEAGIALDQRGWIVVDDTLETSVPGVYAIGDVTGPRRIMLAHMAAAEAHTAVHNILHPEKEKSTIVYGGSFGHFYFAGNRRCGIDGRAGPRAGDSGPFGGFPVPGTRQGAGYGRAFRTLQNRCRRRHRQTPRRSHCRGARLGSHRRSNLCPSEGVLGTGSL